MKTRFCPSPTGLIHLGNARTALFSALAAKAAQGKFLLRIEDTDQERSTVEFANVLQEDLKWLGLHWDEGVNVAGNKGPYWQSQRQAIYDRYYQELLNLNLVYPCFCSEQELALQRKVMQAAGQPPRYSGKCRSLTAEQIAQKQAEGIKPTLRFRMPVNEKIVFQDLVKGEQIFQSDDIGDFIIRRADGTAPFLFCNAIDDALMEVTHALRGDDHLTNTPRQLLILRALKLTPPAYGHLSLILGSDGSPLSKRNGSRSIEEMRTAGFLPEALQNYLARLGHYYADNNFMTLDQLSSQFNYEHLGKAPARFDYDQLLHWQKAAVQQLPHDRLTQWLGEEVINVVPAHKLQEFLTVVHPNILFPADALLWANVFFAKDFHFSAENKILLQAAGKSFFETALQLWPSSQHNIQQLCDQLKNKLNVKGKALFQPLRIALTNHAHGPEMVGIATILGEAEVTKRLQQALQSF